MPAMIMESVGLGQLNHFLSRFNDIIRLMLYVIMYLIPQQIRLRSMSQSQI